jgi:hypothetical protein
MSFTATIDPPGVGQRIIQQIAPRENTFVVELASMKILSRTKSPASAYAFLDGL